MSTPIDPRNPAPECTPCLEGRHGECEGWLGGFCACWRDDCLTDLTEPEETP